nr:HNH endonuclease signature motif containing protein [Paenibacillus polymyxa]
MPRRILRPCNHPGCNQLVEKGYCDKHRKQRDQRRGSATQRGYDHNWRQARLIFLQRNPLCIRCYEKGRLTPVTVVDHITPHKGDPELFWDKKNWQPLCETCHNIKTATEDGGFGN